jgi:hypothetical protein
MNNINILVEAKNEYTSQLQKILRPRLYEGLKSIYDDIINTAIKELEEKKVQTSSVTKTFQKMLKEIPQWNHDMVVNEYHRIEKISNCDYLENLIEAVFITNTKILTSVQINNSKAQNIKINIPQPPHFIHKCYMKCAIEFNKNPYVFDQSKTLTPKEKHNNLREALQLIDNSINSAISDLLPIGDILKQGLTKNKKSESISQDGGEDGELQLEDSSSDDESTYISGGSKSNITDEDNVEQSISINEASELINDIKGVDIDLEKSYQETPAVEQNELLPQSGGEVINLPVEEIVVEQPVEKKEEIDQETPEVKEIILKKEDDNIINLNEEKKEEEFKKIVYDKVTPPFITKIKNIVKVGGESDQNNIVKEDPPKEKSITLSKDFSFEPIYQKKPVKNNVTPNPFIRNIKNNKFIKSRQFGFDKNNNSFYKKKYQENSANYNSVSDKDNIKSTMDEQKRPVKNKIMLGGNVSSDEDEDEELDL